MEQWLEYKIAPRSGFSFELQKDHFLEVTDLKGQQVSDLVCFNKNDLKEKLSSGKTLDFNESIHFGVGSMLYSNRSNVMLEIIEDDVKDHDFLLAPCCNKTFEHFYNDTSDRPSCLGNLSKNLESYGIERDDIPNAFNIFMNVSLDSAGKISVLPPKSQANDKVLFQAKQDLVVSLTACSAEASNNYSFKPIGIKAFR